MASSDVLLARIDTSLLYPPFKDRLSACVEDLASRGNPFYAYFGFRDFDLQAALYRNWLARKGGKAAPPGDSAHQYGLAADCAPDIDLVKPGLQPSWNEKDFFVLGMAALRHNLRWLGNIRDYPHLNYPGFVSKMQLEPLKKKWISLPPQISAKEKLQEIWKTVKEIEDGKNSNQHVPA